MATTLGILAPYLPYGIDIQTNWKDGPRMGQLSSLNYHQNCVGVKLHGEDELQTMLVLELCRPVLLPFWQLCDSLADGTVPAIEALRLALGWPDSFYRTRFTARLYNNIPGEWCVRVENHYDHSGGWIRLGGDYGAWLFEAFDSYEDGAGKQVRVVNPLAAYDYLRSQHFAVDLEPHQFIEAAPTPPIKQEGKKSHE